MGTCTGDTMKEALSGKLCKIALGCAEKGMAMHDLTVLAVVLILPV